MNLEHPEKSAELQASNDGQTPKANRRKLIQTGLAGAPLLLYVEDNPANLRLVEQIAPEFEMVRDRVRSG